MRTPRKAESKNQRLLREPFLFLFAPSLRHRSGQDGGTVQSLDQEFPAFHERVSCDMLAATQWKRDNSNLIQIQVRPRPSGLRLR